MTNPDRINEGDIVQVNFNHLAMTLCDGAVVINRPCATGDSWVFKDIKSGLIHSTSEPCTITKKISSEVVK